MAVINGTSGNDTLADTTGNDTINGLAGDDVISGGRGGSDVVDGGAGRDSLTFMTATSAMVVDFVAGVAGNTRFTGIERVVTGDFNDRLTGNAAAQNLTARFGADTLWGAGGNDTLWGGGDGNTFIFRETGTANADSIGDWNSGTDHLLLDGAVMTALGASGNFSAGDARFWASSTGTAHDTDDRIIYNTATRQIFYDADGNGSGAAQLIATLQSGATLVATDIAVEGGSSGGQVINGTNGHDSLVGTEGNDTMDGGNASDTLRGMGGDDLLADTGTDGTNDWADSLAGGAGNDTLRGNLGNDTLAGGTGNDELFGGEHLDTYVFDATPSAANADVVIGFGTDFDHIVLDANAMTAIGSTGDFSTHDPRFHAAAGAGAAHDADDRIVYDTSSGRLWYDADGSGGAAAQLIATFQSESGGAIPTIAATDFFVVNGSASGQTINGTAGNDSIIGTGGGDTINGLGGNDTLRGQDGNDRLEGGAGNDSLDGGDGVDALIGGDGDDVLGGRDGAFDMGGLPMETLDGGLGNDIFHVDSDDDVILDAGGVDRLVAHNMSWTLGAGFENLTIANDESESGFTGIGNGLDNHIEATWAGSRLEGRDGNDTLVGASGQGAGNELLGGAGNDSLVSGGMGDRLDGGAGADTLIGLGAEFGEGEDFVFSVAPGAANADVIVNFEQFSRIVLDGTAMQQIGPSGAFASNDSRFSANSTGTAQDGSDRVVYNTSNGQLWYDADGSGAGAAQLIATLQGAPGLVANDIVVENGTAQPPDGQVIDGTSGNDTLADTAGNDTINGLAGNDSINGGHGGTDVVNGGDGRDSLQFMTATSAVVVDFGAGTAGTTSFTSIERVVTGDFNDRITGDAAAQNITARGGNDTLAGAGGADTLWGQGGADMFIFRETGTANADVIADWTSGTDDIALDNAAMGALGADGAFVAGDARFWASSTGAAHDANDRVLFNTSNGSLYYDADGNGSGAAQLIATVQAGAAVAATDIVVI